MVINLEKPNNLPLEFRNRLKRLNYLFQRHESYECFEEFPEIQQLENDLNRYCLSHKVMGIHYTRASADSIQAKGLLCRTGEKIRSDFLREDGDQFSETDIDTIKRCWNNYFDSGQARIRDSRVYFNFTHTAVSNGGANNLFCFGGEQIYSGLPERIINKFKNIGTPLIVYCALDPKQLNGIWDPAKILISSYHRLLNEYANTKDGDVWQAVSILPEDIMEIKFVQLLNDNQWRLVE